MEFTKWTKLILKLLLVNKDGILNLLKEKIFIVKIIISKDKSDIKDPYNMFS